MKRRYRRRPGAFDRFMSNQVNTDGTKILEQKPMSFDEEIVQDKLIMEELSDRFMHRQQMLKAARVRRSRQMAINAQREQLMQKANPDLYENYQNAIDEAVSTGILSED